MRTKIKIKEKIIESYDRKNFDYMLTKSAILITKKQKSIVADNPHDSVLDYVDDKRIKAKEKKK